MYRIFIADHFKRQIKTYTKKYRSIAEDIADLLDRFDRRGAQDLGRGLFKVRVKSSNIPRGKSKSFRVIVFVVEVDLLIAPIALYFKGDQEDISKKELNDHLQGVIFELRMQGLFSPR